jgi:glycosyltransferase 2 family protein
VLRRRLLLFFKLAVACGLIVWLFASGKIDLKLLGRLGEHWPWFVAAQVPFGIVMVLAAFRWRLLLRAQGIEYSLRDTFSLTMIGQLFNQLVIGSTGGDMVKAYVVAIEHPSRRSAGITSVFVDRAIGLLVLIIVALVAILLNFQLIRSKPELVSLSVVIAGTLMASLVLGGVFYSDRIRSLSLVQWILARLPFRRALSKVASAVYVYKFHPREIGLSILGSVAVHLCVIGMNLLLARALIDGPIPWQSFFFLIPIAQIAMALPINPPGAVGTAEVFYAELLKLAGIQEGAMICILQRITYYLWALLGCVYYIRRKREVTQAVEEESRDEARQFQGEEPEPPGVVLDAGDHRPRRDPARNGEKQTLGARREIEAEPPEEAG